MYVDTYVKAAFQPRTPPKLSKLFQIFSKDSGGEDRAAYDYIKNAYAYQRQDLTL